MVSHDLDGQINPTLLLMHFSARTPSAFYPFYLMHLADGLSLEYGVGCGGTWHRLSARTYSRNTAYRIVKLNGWSVSTQKKAAAGAVH